MKKLFLMIISVMFVITACTNDKSPASSSEIVPSPTPKAKAVVSLRMQNQYYNTGNGTRLEIGQFCGEISEELENANREIRNEYENLYAEYNGASGNWAEMNFYPQSNSKYLNLNYIVSRYPISNDFGILMGFSYDIENEKLISVEDALKADGLTENKLFEKIDYYCRKNLEMGCDSIASMTLVMNQDDSTTYIVSMNAYILNAGFRRTWFFKVHGDDVRIYEQFPFENEKLDEFTGYTLNVNMNYAEIDTPSPDISVLAADNEILKNNIELAQMYSHTTHNIAEIQNDSDVKYDATSELTYYENYSGYYVYTYYEKNGKAYALDDFFVCDTEYGCLYYDSESKTYIPCFTGFEDEGEGEEEKCTDSSHYDADGNHNDRLHELEKLHEGDESNDHGWLRVPYGA